MDGLARLGFNKLRGLALSKARLPRAVRCCHGDTEGLYKYEGSLISEAPCVLHRKSCGPALFAKDTSTELGGHPAPSLRPA